MHEASHAEGRSQQQQQQQQLVIVNAVTPGIVNSMLGRYIPTWLQIASYPLRSVMMRTPDKGAETVVFAATDSAATNVSGRYFGDCQQIKSSDQSYDVKLSQLVW